MTIYRFVNRKATAYEYASNLLSLAKAMSDIEIPPDGIREIEQRKVLQRRLLQGGHYYSQLYISTTAPVLTSYWQSSLFGILGVTLFISLALVPLTGSIEDPASVAALLLLPSAFGFFAYFAHGRVGRYKIVNRELNEEAKLFYPPEDAEVDEVGRFESLHRLLTHSAAPITAKKAGR
ncbi:hypothetical protein [Arthrobacter sedimenti]|uniref:DUF4231 domain-containing protein n=1 Tax=Arthrobacter sedimenti TaxID=2694931 RepID=A0ABV8WTD9_9MICC